MSQDKKYSHIGNQFVLIIAGSILLALLSNAFFQYHKEKQHAFDNLKRKGESIGTLLSSISIEPLLIYDNVAIDELAESTAQQEHVIYAIFLGPHNNVFSLHVKTEDGLADSTASGKQNEQLMSQLLLNKNIIHLSYPVTFHGKTLATIKIGLDKKPLASAPFENLIIQVSSSVIFGSFIGFGIYIGFLRKVSHPIKKLNDSASQLASFNFDDDVHIPGNNELSELAHTYNEMRITLRNAVITREATLREMEELNASLEDRVRERTNELEALNIQITHQAMHDPLTGLPNRVLVVDRLNKAIEYAERKNNRLAVFILDLNNFKEINDTLGHPEGDLILKQVAERIPNALRQSDTIGRLGGDEFAVVLPEVEADYAEQVGHKIAEVLKPSFELSTQSVDIGASIGIAIYPDHGEDQASLIRHADVAMYQSKKQGISVCVYSPQIDTHTPWRLALMADLRQAITNNNLELHYQPQLDLHTQQIYGVEALLRWNHPQQGYISPDQFVYIAENTGLVNVLTDWVFNQALQQLKRWHRSGIELDMSINISAKNLLNPGLASSLHALLELHDILARYVKLELTESAVMSNPESVLELMQDVRLKGIRYAIDDFGTGYSSLSYLKRLTVDEVKIDKSFVIEMDENEDDATIVRSVIDLTHNLGHSVVAEGVEKKKVMQQLKQLGCNAIQGYLISRPLPADEIPDVISQYQNKTARANIAPG